MLAIGFFATTWGSKKKSHPFMYAHETNAEENLRDLRAHPNKIAEENVS